VWAHARRECGPATVDYVPLRVRVHDDEVPVAPHARVLVVVRLEELAPVRIVAPEPHGDRWVRPCTDELARDAGF
jgi:hypothetical protein